MKRALIEAHQDSQLSDVYRYTFGIVFLGTPHRGSWSADFAHTLTKIIRVVPGNSNLLREVERNSSQLNEINYMFAHVVAQSLLIGLIYETQSTKPIGIVVERSSAILGFPSEICMSVDANHAQLCKFKGRDDLNYKQLSNLIANFREKTLQADVTLDRFPTSIWASSSPTSAKTANDHPIVAHPFPRATNPPQIGPTSTPPAHAELKSPYAPLPPKTTESLAQWIPCAASKKGETSMGLLEMAGSMDQPKDYLNAEMDIIAVHGLRGSPVRSWTNKSPQTMWLRDMLQVDISTSRVMSYGYRTDGVLRRNKFDLDRLAEDFVDSIIDARAGILDTAVRITESYILQGLRRAN